MRIEEFRPALEKAASEVRFSPGATPEAIDACERRLGVTFPANVRRFYAVHDGLRVEAPSLVIRPLDALVLAPGGLLPFASFDHEHTVAFAVDAVNEAGEWSIVSAETGFQVTLTMASFWSNKVFAWVKNQRRIWAEERPEEPRKDLLVGHEGVGPVLESITDPDEGCRVGAAWSFCPRL
ncbi:SMI1/KNR4 family protein [Corallococcus interemptor]|uniref:SMI1/KNR4 family protein n=1 Tax=Corallococcus interemptor TaxID=2316720 RepID=UPI003D08BE46